MGLVTYIHFEMLSFLKGNQLLLLLRLSNQNRSPLPFGFNIKMNDAGHKTNLASTWCPVETTL